MSQHSFAFGDEVTLAKVDAQSARLLHTEKLYLGYKQKEEALRFRSATAIANMHQPHNKLAKRPVDKLTK